MDILKEIEEQIVTIKKSDNSTYIDSIFAHITRAEYYYICGKSDSNFFNDVIYRSNQAYEGALKESYKVLANKTQEEVIKKTPNEIESYFESKDVFRERVLQLFKNYRQEWRNKSTHDFKLFFDENEAFIALTSVSSFVHLLLKQIQEKLSSNIQHKLLEEQDNVANKIKEISSSITESPIDKLINIINEFTNLNRSYLLENTEFKEYEILGRLDAFLDFSDDKVHSQREPKFFGNGKNFRPDFLVSIDEVDIILEVKRNTRENESTKQNSLNQIQQYLVNANLNHGVIFNANFKADSTETKIERIKLLINNKEVEIAIVTA